MKSNQKSSSGEMKILSLDIASRMGWAFYDMERTPSSIECSSIDLTCDKSIKNGVDRRRLMRPKIDLEVCRLIDKYRPDIAVLEQPLNFIGSAKGPRRIKGQASFMPDTGGDDAGGPNANTALLLSQLFAVADTVCRHKCKYVYEVAPRTWQALTKNMPGKDTKERSIAYCETVKIVIPPKLTKPMRGDAADASVIAIWASTVKEIRELQRVI